MQGQDLSRYNEAKARIQAALDKWLTSGVEVFIELQRVEREGHWRAAQHATFSDFLRAEFPTMLGIVRYTNVAKALDIYGADFVRKVGIESCHALVVDAIASNPRHVEEVKRTVEEKYERSGCGLGVEAARKVVRGVVEMPSPPTRDTQRVRKVEELQQQLRQAYGRIRELERDKKRLLAAVDKLERRLARGGARRRSSAPLKAAAKGGSRKAVSRRA